MDRARGQAGAVLLVFILSIFLLFVQFFWQISNSVFYAIFSNEIFCLENRKVNRKSSQNEKIKFSEKEMFMNFTEIIIKFINFYFYFLSKKSFCKSKKFVNFLFTFFRCVNNY